MLSTPGSSHSWRTLLEPPPLHPTGCVDKRAPLWADQQTSPPTPVGWEPLARWDHAGLTVNKWKMPEIPTHQGTKKFPYTRPRIHWFLTSPRRAAAPRPQDVARPGFQQVLQELWMTRVEKKNVWSEIERDTQGLRCPRCGTELD